MLQSVDYPVKNDRQSLFDYARTKVMFQLATESQARAFLSSKRVRLSEQERRELKEAETALLANH